MEYVKGGDLFDYIVEKSRLSEELARKLFRQLVSAVMYIHENLIVHRGILSSCSRGSG
jgi:serine/threonine protein kinase